MILGDEYYVNAAREFAGFAESMRDPRFAAIFGVSERRKHLRLYESKCELMVGQISESGLQERKWRTALSRQEQ